MNAQKFLPLLLIAAAGITSCDQGDPTPYTAGKNGQTKLQVVPRHHGKQIEQCKIYIKYNTLDKPGSYDDSSRVIMTDGTPIATFDHLRMGNYYIYGAGFDPTIAETVTGGAPVVINETGTTITYNLPVSENHGGGN
jgi:hypothetical protein